MSVTQQEHRGNGFRCEVCGRWHDHPSRDIAFGLPDAIFQLSDEEREQRGWISSDICVLDDEAHFIRGVLSVPVPSDGGRIAWGVWARIRGADFGPYSRIWGSRDAKVVAEYTGHLANEIHPYPDSLGLEVVIRVQGGARRPTFAVISDVHQLGIDLRFGISPEQAAEQMSTYHCSPAASPPTFTDKVRWLVERVWPCRRLCDSRWPS